jgi:hypothetical protein
VRDGSFNENNYNGALAFLRDHPDASVTPPQEKTGNVTYGNPRGGKIVFKATDGEIRVIDILQAGK